ncbi:polysaccharide lyase 6 family protein [Sphingomicrobium clamense]|uniref:Polysaccharide lyase 6 family protein n=1 Tax=Sphingomicrobium clamense TaxID=2851013 RepID=A0ABS6V4M7_9SPHN|nr:polysaccharide lyase 6 family protein [Sphingomicrobium sp. B8]MBW0144508.1 polysaccharide lyase 6 family protein [Sphingomicrobium sp. B8]
MSARHLSVPMTAAMLALAATPASAADILVQDQRQFRAAMQHAEPGDAIILANGEWRDFRMVVTGNGTARRPITVRAQTPGRVILSGRSNLRIGGNHLLVDGLVFRNGFSPTNEVISFRAAKGRFANNSRVTNTVIDGFTKPRAGETDFWIVLYGKNNRFDHNHIVGKANKGTTLSVRLHDAAGRNNGHRIDHNYFGPRPYLGENGAETIRIGTSSNSRFTSNTLVERNIFDRTDGELEIVSVKSGGNVIRDNLFLRARGTLTLRHGDGNLVERNVFFGHGKKDTGGIRIIARDQVVRANYMEGLTGTGLFSALSVMNGMPNSPAHKHVPVERAQIERNSVLNSKAVTIGAGANPERTRAPRDSMMRSNLFDGGLGGLIKVASSIDGITSRDNAIAGTGRAPAGGFRAANFGFSRARNGLLYPTDPALASIGAPRDLAPLRLEQVGTPFYPKPS